jgi:hypothetical protein
MPSGDQLKLAIPAIQDRNLFPVHFLQDRLPEWPEYAEMDTDELFAKLSELWEREGDLLPTFNEEQTEDRFVRPVLEALGFLYTTRPKHTVDGRRREPDYALFSSEQERRDSEHAEGQARYASAVALLEAKRFDRPLDRRRAGAGLSEDPVAQIIYYVSTTRVPFGILTNGRLWRLYAQEGDMVEGAYYEVDLVALLETGDRRALRDFALFFSRNAFERDQDSVCFLDRALSESQANAVEVGSALQRQVFAAVPSIAKGLLGEDPASEENLANAFEHALVFLYRLLFCLHAEARGLLPIRSPHYLEYSVRRQRLALAEAVDRGQVFSASSDRLYNELEALFKLVAVGDASLGVNEYNGDLFSTAKHPWLRGRAVPDKFLAGALDGLYRLHGQTIDYRDLSIRQLGTIYERLLEYRLQSASAGTLELAHASGRRDTGSYFTPEPIVDLIVERTLEPLLEKRSSEIQARGLKGKRALDAFLGLRILDPAMGSGHFLVSAASYIAKFIATDPSYDGPLDWLQIERLVAERCIYGVDLNPMAVELAKLSLWLSTVRGDVPLTFLRNLRVGNSLVGADLDSLEADEVTVFSERLARDAKTLLARTAEVERLESDSGKHVHEKERIAERAELLRQPLHEFADDTIAQYFAEPTPMFHWEIEFPEVFLSKKGQLRSDGGFDAVLGNPPYIRIQSLGRDLATWCRRQYDVAFGSFDAYLVFIERAVRLLAPGGRLGFIVPNKFLKLDSARRLRADLVASRQIEEIIDFGAAQLFDGATNYTSILILDTASREDFLYRKILNAREGLRVFREIEDTPAESFSFNGLSEKPWTLASGEEKQILDAASAGSVPLGEVTRQIFQGLITSADPVYIVEDRGSVGALRNVYSRASDAEFLLEPNLLHPLASGAEVDRYAFRPQRDLLLFPYQAGLEGMELLSDESLRKFPRTAAYLAEHEERLRGRENGKMDRPGWYGYVYPKNLGLHELPKLGIPRLVDRLRASADPEGRIYLDNVDVNGLLPDPTGPSLWVILALLNSQLLDYVFRLSSVPFRGNYYSANKQFISPLPIRLPGADVADGLEARAESLHENATEVHREQQSFRGWLSDLLGVPIEGLPGQTKLMAAAQSDVSEITAILLRAKADFLLEPGSRSFREALVPEHRLHAERIAALTSHQAALESEIDELVFDLFEISQALRRRVCQVPAHTHSS